MGKRNIIIFLDEIAMIGGIETWLYNLTSLLKNDFNFLVLWRNADPQQLARLQVPHELYDASKQYYCDILLNIIDGRPHAVRAKRIIQVVHANYAEIMDTYRYHHWDLVDGIVFVSETARKNFTHSLANIENTVLGNPIYVDPKQKKHEKRKNIAVLQLMAATRLTSEKGGQRIVKLLESLHKANISVEMHVWTHWTLDKFIRFYNAPAVRPFLVFHQPKLDLSKEMAQADYVVQLSDCESFCYTIHEALALHTPVIVTDWQGVRSVVKDGENGYILPMDMLDLSLDKLFHPPTISTAPHNCNGAKWKKYLSTLELPPTYIGPKFNYFMNY